MRGLNCASAHAKLEFCRSAMGSHLGPCEKGRRRAAVQRSRLHDIDYHLKSCATLGALYYCA